MKVGVTILVALALVAPAAAQTRGRSTRPVPVSTETLYDHLAYVDLPLPDDDDATRAGGTVHVEATVSTEGEVVRARAVSGPAGLRARAVAVVREWLFRPVEVDGVARTVRGVLLLRYAADRSGPEAWLAMPNGERWNPSAPVDSISSSAPPAVSPSPAQPRVFRLSTGSLAGTAIRRIEPVYPRAAAEAGVEGVVVVEVRVGVDGTVADAQAVVGHPLLRDAALDAVRHWRFTPPRFEDAPVEIIGSITFRFPRR